MNRWSGVALLLGAVLVLPLSGARAQQPATAGAGVLRTLPSGRARTTVTLLRGDDRTALWIYADYGQPHARGRQVRGTLIPLDTVWRAGANEATTFRTDVDLTLGGAAVPRGTYTLFVRGSRAGWQLIVSRKVGEWGTAYDQSADLVRVPLRARTLAQPLESFTMWLVPEVIPQKDGRLSTGLARGVLRMAWGDLELTADWVAH